MGKVSIILRGIWIKRWNFAFRLILAGGIRLWSPKFEILKIQAFLWRYKTNLGPKYPKIGKVSIIPRGGWIKRWTFTLRLILAGGIRLLCQNFEILKIRALLWRHKTNLGPKYRKMGKVSIILQGIWIKRWNFAFRLILAGGIRLWSSKFEHMKTQAFMWRHKTNLGPKYPKMGKVSIIPRGIWIEMWKFALRLIMTGRIRLLSPNFSILKTPALIWRHKINLGQKVFWNG